MMQNLLAKWRSVPYTLSVFIWMVGLILIGDRIGASSFQSDFRLRLTFISIAAIANYSMHELIYQRKRLGELLVSLGIFAPFLVLAVWLSFALFDAASPLNFLPIIVAALVAWGVEVLVRRKARKQ